MMATLALLQNEVTCNFETDSVDFTFQTKSGKQYSHKIRNLLVQWLEKMLGHQYMFLQKKSKR